MLNKVEFKGSELYSVKWHPVGELSTRPLSPGPQKPATTAKFNQGEEDFMDACREKIRGPFAVTLEDIIQANSGESKDKKDAKPEAKKHVLGLPSPDKKKKKKKKTDK